MTTIRGTRERVEEDWDYAHKQVDSPAYTRFAASISSTGTPIGLHRGCESGPHSLAAQAKQDECDVLSLE